jgi:hypothetical protein
MKMLLTCVGTLALVAGATTALAGQALTIDAEALEVHQGRTSIRDWAFGAILWTPLKLKDWLLVVSVLVLVALNVVLWSLPISQQQLFYISFPLGLATFAGLLWFIGRERDSN